MKTLIALLTAVIGMLTVMPEAQAAPARSTSSHEVGGGYYTTVEYRKVRRLVGHTRHGKPIYRWKTVAVYHKHFKKSSHHRRHRH